MGYPRIYNAAADMVDGHAAAGRAAKAAFIDPDETLKEITRRNNSVAVECDTPTVPPKQHSSP